MSAASWPRRSMPMAGLLWARRDELPVVDHEIGDSWIYGVGSGPSKVSRFLALQRLYDGLYLGGVDAVAPGIRSWTDDGPRTYLGSTSRPSRDETAWGATLSTPQGCDPRFAFTAQSGTNKALFDAAVDQLDADDRPAPLRHGSGALCGGRRCARWRGRIDRWTVCRGAADVARLTSPNGQHLDGLGGMLLGFRYESWRRATSRPISTAT